VAVNALAKEIAAPRFAYTDNAEVRRLRMRMMPIVPALFLRDLKSKDENGRACIREKMSPVEAVYLFARMVDQKLSNPNYQMTAEERQANWATTHGIHKPISAGPNPKTKEIFDAVTVVATTMNLRDMAASATDIISRLVAQKGGQ
jgi:hypothetical protein